jgi:predicted acetyltransferase
LILSLALPETLKLGIERALITCDATNIGSRKIIEANGGVLWDETRLIGRDVPVRRYWIDLI